jgi:nucleotide-binding universal stress UspA family protein
MFRTVVVPLDGSTESERALGPAASVARESRARLVVIVAAPGPASAAGLETELKERFDGAGLNVDEVLVDTFVRADDLVAERLGEEPVPLVCMASHGREGVERALLGSMAERVARRATSPVLLVGPNCPPTADPTRGWAMLTLDGSAVSSTIAPLAIEWAHCFRMTPSIATVLEPLEAKDTRMLPGETAEVVAVHSVAEELVREGLHPRWDVLHGRDVAVQIADCATRLPAAVILMSSHGRSGLARIALGSVAMSVVRRAPCPVLVRRPPEPSE